MQQEKPLYCSLAEPRTVGRGRQQRPACCVAGCRKAATRNYGCCARHYHLLLKTADPARYLFYQRKTRAKTRGKEWTIELPNFRDWCAHFRYCELTGRAATALSIDRRVNAHGYHVWNIAPLPLGLNSSKGASPAALAWAERERAYYAGNPLPDEPDEPDAYWNQPAPVFAEAPF